MVDALALTVAVFALGIALRCWRRIAALAPPPNVVQSQIETEPDHSDAWARFLASEERERFERALKSGVEVE